MIVYIRGVYRGIDIWETRICFDICINSYIEVLMSPWYGVVFYTRIATKLNRSILFCNMRNNVNIT